MQEGHVADVSGCSRPRSGMRFALLAVPLASSPAWLNRLHMDMKREPHEKAIALDTMSGKFLP